MNNAVWHLQPPVVAYNTVTIHSLPVELLSYVFDLATHSTEYQVADDIPFDSESVKAPLRFSAVCRRWCAIARGTPYLWTSLCATIDSIFGDAGEYFDSRHFTSYLNLSRNYPLDILIDARDPNWDFSEPEIPSRYEYSTYVPPFQAAHTATAISYLLSHIGRWRSLVILTDTWAPMYSAVCLLNLALYSCGAPLLESITLMRCNEFVSHAPVFQPPGLKDPAFLSPPSSTTIGYNILPKLENLTLTGVHADWTALHDILQHSSSPLRSLELLYHSYDVRPSPNEFYDILTVTPYLQSLTVHGSGPTEEEEDDDASRPPIFLSHLQEVVIGYRSDADASSVLGMLNAPNVLSLTVEDATHAGDPDEIDAGELLSYIALGNLQDHRQDFVVTYSVDGGMQYHRGGALSETSDTLSESPFPALETVRMRRVKAFPEHFERLYASLPNLKKLKLKEMSLESLEALTPPASAPPGYRCLCPELQSLTMKGLSDFKDLPSALGKLSVHRVMRGAKPLTEINVVVGSVYGPLLEAMCIPSVICGTKVRILCEVAPEEDELFDDEEDRRAAEAQAYELGGAFNDPVFDAWFLERSQ